MTSRQGLPAEEVALRWAIGAAERELGSAHPRTRRLVARRVSVLIRLGRDAEAPSLGAIGHDEPEQSGTTMHAALVELWAASPSGDHLIAAWVGHALEFPTWESFVRRQDLTSAQLVDLVVEPLRCLTVDGHHRRTDGG